MQELTVIKIGGNILDNPDRLRSFLVDFAQLKGSKLLVHGGGKIASAIGQRLGIEPIMIEGRRVTDTETLELVTMVYGGLVNKQVVAQLQSLDCNAIGLTGADANTILAKKRPVGKVNYGFAGDIESTDSINIQVLRAFLDAGLTPVFAPLTHNGEGTMLNTNADTIASVLAVALSKIYQVKLMYCFEKKGVLADASDDESVVSTINQVTYKNLKEEEVITAGMIPKLDNAFAALQQGVKEVLIGSAESVNSIKQGTYNGTTITLQ